MKVIVAGTRTLKVTPTKVLNELMSTGWRVDKIVSGGCKGPDKAGEQVADLEHVPLKVFKAKWKEHGRAAGPIRNAKMADYADALLAFWDGKSRGTMSMIAMMNGRKKLVHVVQMTKEKKK